MKLRALRRTLLFLVLIAVLVAPRYTYSCGPFFEETVFSYTQSPNVPLTKFYAGDLGVLLPSTKRSYLVIAYRYLMDLELSPQAQKTLLGPEEPQGSDQNPGGQNSDQSPAVMAWVKARTRIPDAPKPQIYGQTTPISKDDPYQQFLNCPDNAFVTAVRTLDDRIGKYGSGSDVKEWLVGQDAVFANCNGAGPAVLPSALPSGPAWLKTDRTYQTAAASFYARDFDQALKLFDAIAGDRSSPWSAIAPYLAARVMIRKATLLAGKDQPFDKVVMTDAEARLQKILRDPTRRKTHDDVKRMLGFVRFRTHPAERLAELEAAITGKESGPDFRQNLRDYLLIGYRGTDTGDLTDWLLTFQRSAYAPDNKGRLQPPDPQVVSHAIQRWNQGASLPWLMAALNLVPPADSAVSKLLADAEKVSVRSPGYLSVRYYALRVMAATDRKAEARRELDGILARDDLPVGVRNLFVQERLPLATSFDDFLKYAAQTPAGLGVDENFGDDVPPVKPAKGEQPVFLDTYAAKLFAKRLPLALYGEAAASASVPRSLQRDLVRAGWTRAILLNDLATATNLSSQLMKFEPSLQGDLKSFQSAPSDAEKKFAAILLVLKHPGLKPYVVRGAGRQNPFLDTSEEPLAKIDDLRDNWWCASMGANPASINYAENEDAEYGEKGKKPELQVKDPDADFPYPDFLTPTQRADATQQWEELTKLGAAPNYLSGQVVEWATSHPDDKRVPEALYLAVRSTRYGCTNKQTTKYSKSAFDLLHQNYPQSEWAKKTKYHF
jgi:hypothetical protein